MINKYVFSRKKKLNFNFQGEYCMPLNGTKLSERSELLTNNEMVRLVSLFVKEGVDKIRITGGEPTVRKDIVQVVGEFII